MLKKEISYPSAALNCAITDTSVSFDPQMPLGNKAGTSLNPKSDKLIPPGIVMLDSGKMRLTFMAPEAQSVTAEVHREVYALEKDDDSIWSAVVEGGCGGFCPVVFRVNGVEVLNPMAPIGFGASRPINYADIPQPEQDFFLCKNVPHGSVVQEYYDSAVTGTMKSCLVYTPAGYMKETSGEYPVLYLQHGHGENEQCWVHQGRMNFIMDNLIAAGKAEPCIVVMNDGMVQKAENDVRVLDQMMIERLLLEDCIPFIESRYRVRTDKWSRAMAGLSMGSMQTSIVTMKHPDMFGYAGVFSGFVSPFGTMSAERAHVQLLEDREEFSQSFKVFFRACGDEDFVALDRFRADSAMFEKKGLGPADCSVHVEKMYPGEHEWNVWRMCLRDFVQYLFH